MARKRKPRTAKRAASIGAATPKDHMEAEASGGGLREVTVQGITIKVDPTVISNDWEFVEKLAALQEGTASLSDMVGVTNAILGDHIDDVKKHLRGEDGRVSSSDMSEFIIEVFGALDLGN